MTGTQSGLVIGATRTSPGSSSVALARRACSTRTVPGDDAGRRRRGRAPAVGPGRRRARLPVRARRRAERRDRARLHEEDRRRPRSPTRCPGACRSAPRPAARAGRGRATSSSVSTRGRGRGRRRGRCAGRAPSGPRTIMNVLYADADVEEPRAVLGDARTCRARPVRRRRPRRARTRPRSRSSTRSPVAGSTVNITPMRSDVDHPLHDDGDRGLVGDAAGSRRYDDDALAEQRRPAVDDALEQLVVAAHVRERLVHARERRVGGVLGGRRRAHRDPQRPAPSAVIRLEQLACASASGMPALRTSSCSSAAQPSASACGVVDVERRRELARGRRARRLRPSRARYAGAVTTNPGGTGKPARASTRRGWRPCRRRWRRRSW